MTLEALILQRLREVYAEAGFEYLTLRLDTLHDFAAAGRLAEVTELPAERVRGWLGEIIYVARETIREIDARPGPDRRDRLEGDGHPREWQSIPVKFEQRCG